MDRVGGKWPQRHPVIVFLIAANFFTLSCAFLAHSPVVALTGVPQLLFSYAAKFGPSVGAIAAAAVVAGRVGIRALLTPLSHWRSRPGWYLLAVGGPIVMCGVAVLLTALATGRSLAPDPVSPILVAAAFLRPIVLGGGLGEEIGWRGFMLPNLQTRFSPIRASLIVGLFWGLWHTPAFFISGSGKSGGVAGLALFVILCMVLSAVFTWVFNASGGKLLLLVLLHGCQNGALDAADRLFPLIKPDLVWAILLLLLTAMLAAVTRLGRPATLRITEIG